MKIYFILIIILVTRVIISLAFMKFMYMTMGC